MAFTYRGRRTSSFPRRNITSSSSLLTVSPFVMICIEEAITIKPSIPKNEIRSRGREREEVALSGDIVETCASCYRDASDG